MTFLKEINPEVDKHLRKIADKMCQGDENFYRDLVKAWHKKEKIFMKQLRSYQMTIESRLDKQEERAFILLTYSGSILGVGPVNKNRKRQMIYASIGMRKEVPEKLLEDNISLDSDVELDKDVSFSGGTLKKSSPVYKIALMNHKSDQEQVQQLEDATRIMTKEFVSINNTIVPS